MRSEHTPGPWHLFGSKVSGKDREVALILWEHARYGMPAREVIEAEDRANARLIASAPKLLEACKKVLTLRQWVIEAGGKDGPLPQAVIEQFAEMEGEIDDFLRVAVREAEGAQ